jgi:hypothetical protein
MHAITELIESIKRSDEMTRHNVELLRDHLLNIIEQNGLLKSEISGAMGKHSSYLQVTLSRENVSVENIVTIAEAVCRML